MDPLVIVFGLGVGVLVGLTGIGGGSRHFRNGTVDLGTAGWLAIGSVPGSIGGVVLVESLPSPPDTALLWGVAGALVFTSLVTLGRALFVPRVHERERDAVPLTTATKRTAVGLGVVLGFVLGV